MSQGQATRSTFTLARVTHFIAASGGWLMIKSLILLDVSSGFK
jgi:hypothetical protein